MKFDGNANAIPPEQHQASAQRPGQITISPMSLFSGSDVGGLGEDSGSPAHSVSSLSIQILSDDDSDDSSLFVRQDDIKPEGTDNGSRSRSRSNMASPDTEDTDSSDGSDSGSGSGSDMDTDDDNGQNGRNADINLDDSDGDDDDDSDDDCIVVSADDLPDHVKTIFANKAAREAANGAHIGPDEVKVEEPQDGALAIPSNADNGSDSESDSEFEISDDDLSDGERPKKRRRSAPRRQSNEEPANEQWRMPTEDELLNLCTQQEELNMLKEQRALTIQETLDLARISARISAVERMAQLEATQGEGQGENGAPGQPSGRGPANSWRSWPQPLLPQGPVLSQTPSPAPSEGHRPAGAGEPPRRQPGGTKRRRSHQPKPKTPKEYWQRRYAEHGPGIRKIEDAHDKRRHQLARQPRTQRQGNQNGDDDSVEARVMSMFKETDPVMARAAQGAMPLPEHFKARTQAAQYKALRDRVMGNPIVSSADEQDKLRIDQANLEEAVRSFGYRKVRALDGQWKIPGMKSPLYNHQMVAASWILRQEFSPEPPHGGILADHMGLGKTVEMLAGMSGNRPTPEDVAARRHQTLIVAPAGVIKQWEREINKHCELSFVKKVHHYKASKAVPPEEWQTADIL